MFVLHIEEFSCQDHADHSKFIPFSITQKKKKQKQKNIATFTPCTQSTVEISWRCEMNQWINDLSSYDIGQRLRFLNLRANLWSLPWLEKQTSLDMLWMDQWGVKGGPWSFCRFNYCIPWKRDGNLNRKCIWTNFLRFDGLITCKGIKLASCWTVES